MPRSSTPSFVVERRMITNKADNSFLEQKLKKCSCLQRIAIKHYSVLLKALRKDVWYQESLQAWEKSNIDEEKKKLANEIYKCANFYCLTEYGIHSFLGRVKNGDEYYSDLNIDIIQKLGTNIYQAIKKNLFRPDGKIHIRYPDSMSAKKANTGIIYRDKTGEVYIMGRSMKLKPVRAKDYWMMEALTHKIKYCRIVRRAHGIGYHYFLQIVMEGISPKKVKRGDGRCGIDQGTSTLAYVTDNGTVFKPLAPDIHKYEKEVIKWARIYERRRRMANPECFNQNGTIKKGAKFKNFTRGIRNALMHLKDAYRRKAAYIRQTHGHLTNEIVEACDSIILEPMNWQALVRRAGSEKKKNRKKNPTQSKTNNKNRRKKRFGRSSQRHAPGLLTTLIKQKATRYGIELIEIDARQFKASQYDHVTDSYKKATLSARVKKIGGHKVQRDLYSAFLLYNYLDISKPDRERCIRTFKHFLKTQGITVNTILKNRDTTKTFGIKAFAA